MHNAPMKQPRIFIYGRHALIEALTNRPDVISNVFIDPSKVDAEIKQLASRAGLKIADLKTGKQKVSESESHQGFIGKINVDKLITPYQDFITSLKITPQTGLVILGEIQDPHNVGAIIRSAAAFGISGVLMPSHNQSSITGAVVKVSAGMAFRIPLVEIGNTSQTIRDLKSKGFWIYGLAGEGEQSLPDEKFESPSAFVLGNESTGIRAKTKEVCDIMLRIPISPNCESLNVAASAATTLYAWSLKHRQS